MARTVASLPAGSRITDYISLGVLTKAFPLDKVMAVVAAAGKTNQRQRDLPAHVVVYYVIALTLYMQVSYREVLRCLLEGALYMQVSYREVLRCLLEGVKWLLGPEWEVKVAGKSGISQARTRLGWEPLQQLHDQVVAPIAVQRTKGAWYRHWRSVSLDGCTLEVADNQDNEKAFGRPSASRGTSAYPQVRFVSLVESGTHVLFGTQMSGYRVGEITLAHKVLPALKEGMLCLADRNFYGYDLWNKARASGADLLWRVKKNLRLPCEERLSDGSYLSTVYRSDKDRRRRSNAVRVRVIEYTLEGVAGAEPIYRLVTSILDPSQAPAQELAALYHERWEIETTLDELKTHLRGSKIILRSKTPELVRQEFYGLMMTHFAVRGLMHEAALQDGEDPDRLSFIHAVRVVRRKLPRFVAIPPSGQKSVS